MAGVADWYYLMVGVSVVVVAVFVSWFSYEGVKTLRQVQGPCATTSAGTRERGLSRTG